MFIALQLCIHHLFFPRFLDTFLIIGYISSLQEVITREEPFGMLNLDPEGLLNIYPKMSAFYI